jgi:hypothetical protein
MTEADPDGRPPRWTEVALWPVLPPKDRAAVSGDLLEEYCEAVLPTRGSLRAGVWYLRQVVSFMTYSNASLLRVFTVASALAVTAMIASGTWFVATHRSSSDASQEAAEQEFRQLRARFADQQPLLDMDQRRARADMSAANNVAHLHTVHTVIFDTRGGQRVVRMDVPYWFARTFARPRDRYGSLQWLGQLSFLDDTEFDPEPIRLSWDQVERRGPGLIADYRHPSGGQFISWVD